MTVQCFFLEPTKKTKRWLRRYKSGVEYDCPTAGNFTYHQTFVPLDVVEGEEGTWEQIGREDPRWQNTCACGYAFAETDQWQVFTDGVYRRTDTGEELALRDAPAGAMWYATWLPKNMYWDNKTDDHLCVRLPDGTDWCVDSRCNNCTLPDDRLHRCWVRAGEPPTVTVGKSGVTCAAGAGSIQSPGWHGFLVNGVLKPC